MFPRPPKILTEPLHKRGRTSRVKLLAVNVVRGNVKLRATLAVFCELSTVVLAKTTSVKFLPADEVLILTLLNETRVRRSHLAVIAA